MSVRERAMFLALGFAACGDPDATSDADRAMDAPADVDAGEPVPLANLAREIARASCGRLFACCSSEEIAHVFESFVPADSGECIEVITALLELLTSRAQASLGSGRAAYDDEAARTCVTRIEETECGALTRFSFSIEGEGTACSGVLSPRLETGDACSESFECADGICALGLGGRECTPAPIASEACDFECAPGLRCITGQCRAPLTLGENCATSAECESGGCIDGACAPASLCAS